MEAFWDCELDWERGNPAFKVQNEEPTKVDGLSLYRFVVNAERTSSLRKIERRIVAELNGIKMVFPSAILIIPALSLNQVRMMAKDMLQRPQDWVTFVSPAWSEMLKQSARKVRLTIFPSSKPERISMHPLMQTSGRSLIRVPLAFIAAQATLKNLFYLPRHQAETTIYVADCGQVEVANVKYDKGVTRLEDTLRALDYCPNEDFALKTTFRSPWGVFSLAYLVMCRRGQRKISVDHKQAMLLGACICQLEAFMAGEINLLRVTKLEASAILAVISTAGRQTKVEDISIFQTFEVCLVEAASFLSAYLAYESHRAPVFDITAFYSIDLYILCYNYISNKGRFTSTCWPSIKDYICPFICIYQSLATAPPKRKAKPFHGFKRNEQSAVRPYSIPTTSRSTDRASIIPSASRSSDRASIIPSASRSADLASSIPTTSRSSELASGISTTSRSADLASGMPTTSRSTELASGIPTTSSADLASGIPTTSRRGVQWTAANREWPPQQSSYAHQSSSRQR